jgi:transposase-like protein
MAKNQFADPRFNDEDAARAWFEAARWPAGPVCPKCGVVNHAYKLKGKPGVYRCAEPKCRKDFTVMTGSVMERSHAPLTQWAIAFYMGASSKKGFSAHQLHRALGCEYNTAWFLHHRVMEAMRRGGLELPKMGGDGEPVEMDETYYGSVDQANRRATRKMDTRRPGSEERPYKRTGHSNKRTIIALVERGGEVRSFHVPRADAATVTAIVNDNIVREATLYTDESKLYAKMDQHVAEHDTVRHSAKEYARGPVHTNTVEGFFSIFKRGMGGVYQHCAEKNLHRYLAEFDFRYNTRHMTDEERSVLAVQGGVGKRLTYHQPD